MSHRVFALLLILALLAAPAAAFGQSPFAPLPPAAPPPVEPESQNGDDTGGGPQDGLAGWQQALILAAGAGLIAGIGFVIVRDAKRRAPVDEHRPRDDEPRDPHSPRRKAQARTKGKAAKAARRRNR